MTARCGLHMSALRLKIFGCLIMPTAILFPRFLTGFSSDAMNTRTKFEVRNFSCSRDSGGNPKIWTVPGCAHDPFSPKFLLGFCSDGPCECMAKVAVRSFTRS